MVLVIGSLVESRGDAVDAAAGVAVVELARVWSRRCFVVLRARRGAASKVGLGAPH